MKDPITVPRRTTGWKKMSGFNHGEGRYSLHLSAEPSGTLSSARSSISKGVDVDGVSDDINSVFYICWRIQDSAERR
jgi:hypothetical protein